MNQQPFERPPRWWGPKISRSWVKFWRPFLLREQIGRQKLLHVDVRGLDNVQRPLQAGDGILITPNHPGHADSFALYSAAHALNTPFYVMVAWQVFQQSSWIKRMVLGHHGCFSVDREATDLTALKQARAVLESEPYPLAIFPEGEVYHLNDRVTPFREGPVSIALMAAKKATRPVVCVPCAIKYQYLEDPTPQLLQTMTQLEQALLWRPRPDLPLTERIYRFAAGLLALKEVEYLGQTGDGPLPGRLQAFMNAILQRVENRLQLDPADWSIPERVKLARQAVIKQVLDLPENSAARQRLYDELDDLFLVVQAFSYPGDYVAEHASIERLAETIDKFEEDVLGVPTATVRGARKATVTFGEPILVGHEGGRRKQATDLTQLLEQRVQELLDTNVPT